MKYNKTKEERGTIVSLMKNIDVCYTFIIVRIELLPRPDNGFAQGSIEFLQSRLVFGSRGDGLVELCSHEFTYVWEVVRNMKEED